MRMTMIARQAQAIAISIMIGAGVAFPTYATTLTFDDIPEDQRVPDGYGGLIWTNLSTVDACDRPAIIANSGLCFGRISAANVIFSELDTTLITSQTGTFSLNSFYMTASFRDGLEVTIDGIESSGAQQTLNLSISLSPTLYVLNWADLKIVSFNILASSGTQNPSVGADVPSFAIDNMTINENTAVPEPQNITYFIVGLTGILFLRRRRRIV